MRIVIFTHSLVSDWNHGNAHFLRGVSTELVARGHEVAIYEPEAGWSRTNLLQDAGPLALTGFQHAYPTIRSVVYDERTISLPAILDRADIVIVHEWNSHDLVSRVGQHHAQNRSYRLFFHDTHHRTVTDLHGMAAYDLQHYDGVLAYGNIIRDLYLQNRWARQAWTWHEAADTRVFRPIPGIRKLDSLVWIGNWGDGERAEELREFLIEPVKRLGIKATVYGVRYPKTALDELASANIEYGGWLPNFCVPHVFAQSRVTVHVPRRPYASSLPGIPTIRPFEALACGISLISAPWQDAERLFRTGQDYRSVTNGAEMTEQLRFVLSDSPQAKRSTDQFIANGLDTIQSRHTCAHRVNELLAIASGEPN